jgi:hypothetical protein
LKGRGSDTIQCGSASGVLQVDSDGVGTASFTGLMMPARFLALGVRAMDAGVRRGAKGLLYCNDQAAIGCDPPRVNDGRLREAGTGPARVAGGLLLRSQGARVAGRHLAGADEAPGWVGPRGRVERRGAHQACGQALKRPAR